MHMTVLCFGSHLDCVWQVREAIYRNSSGRWRHYERHLAPVRRMLTPDAGAPP